MAFWGIEVRPGKSYTHRYEEFRGRLRVCQATLGNGKEAVRKSVLQCNVGSRSPVLLCSLIPNQSETCQLKLEFEEQDDVVFSVIGPSSVHLSGFFLGRRGRGADDDDDTDSFGEDIGEEDSYDSYGSDEDEYESDFIDDSSFEMFPSSPPPKSSVVIEEIVEDDKPANGNGTHRRLRKKYQMSDTDDCDDGSHQLIVKSNTSRVLDSEDEDGFPISLSLERKNVVNNGKGTTKDASKIVDGCRKRKMDVNSNHAESAREDCQLHNSVFFQEDGAKISEISRKKKKVQDQNSLENLPKASSSETTCTEQNQVVDDKVIIITEKHDGKPRKKKREKAKKCKTSEMGFDPSSEKKEKLARADSNEVRDIDGNDYPSEAEKLPVSKKESSRKNKKANKNTRVKAETNQELACSSTELLNRELQAGSQQASNDILRISDVVLKSSKEDEKMDEALSTKELPKDKVSGNIGVAQEAKKKNKNKKNKNLDKDSDTNQESLNLVGTEDKVGSQKPMMLANGLTVEKLSMGKPDGKKASSGKKVFMNYVGKLKNGKIFDSNVGKRPFKFVLGRGEVIKGWDIGVKGMRVGEKRKLTIPPSLGYGQKNLGPIPGNSWLIFDIELVDVQ